MPVPVPSNAAEFREAAPAFASPAIAPDDAILFWLNVGGLLFNVRRWDDMLGLGIILFVEHNLALEALAVAQGDAGGIPGLNKGVISSESAKSVSASYDTGAATEPGAGHWNLTTYGTRLMRMVGMFGAGPMQLNVGPGGTCGPFVQLMEWSGPPCGPGWGGAWGPGWGSY
jgi:hypothetical protein